MRSEATLKGRGTGKVMSYILECSEVPSKSEGKFNLLMLINLFLF
jgi:hypothetical protein